jgi:hypothetical protein
MIVSIGDICVANCLLIHKLYHYGIRGKTNRWIQSFLRDRNQSVVVEDETSKSIPVESDVPQGSVLSPACSYTTMLVMR